MTPYLPLRPGRILLLFVLGASAHDEQLERPGVCTVSVFVPFIVTRLSVQEPAHNWIRVELGGADACCRAQTAQVLGPLPCSGRERF